MAKKILDPIHPREILMEEFLKPMGISQYGKDGVTSDYFTFDNIFMIFLFSLRSFDRSASNRQAD